MFSVNVHSIEYSVGFTHNREMEYTSCTITFEAAPEHTSIAKMAFANCHPKDNFCRNTGRKIALTRAIDQFAREDRALFWDAYFAKLGKVK